jgi:hypothetical protein
MTWNRGVAGRGGARGGRADEMEVLNEGDSGRRSGSGCLCREQLSVPYSYYDHPSYTFLPLTLVITQQRRAKQRGAPDSASAKVGARVGEGASEVRP